MAAWANAPMASGQGWGWALNLPQLQVHWQKKRAGQQVDNNDDDDDAAAIERLRQRGAGAEGRFELAAKSVMFARELERLVLAEVPEMDAENFAAAWRQAERRASLALSHDRPTEFGPVDQAGRVTVDGNVFKICSKLERLRASGFAITAPLPDAQGDASEHYDSFDRHESEDRDRMSGGGGGGYSGGGGGVRPNTQPEKRSQSRDKKAEMRERLAAPRSAGASMTTAMPGQGGQASEQMGAGDFPESHVSPQGAAAEGDEDYDLEGDTRQLHSSSSTPNVQSAGRRRQQQQQQQDTLKNRYSNQAKPGSGNRKGKKRSGSKEVDPNMLARFAVERERVLKEEGDTAEAELAEVRAALLRAENDLDEEFRQDSRQGPGRRSGGGLAGKKRGRGMKGAAAGSAEGTPESGQGLSATELEYKRRATAAVQKQVREAEDHLEILQRRIWELEEEQALLHKKLKGAEDAREGAADKARELAKKLASAQGQFTAALRAKDEAMEQQKLLLEERHSAELASAMGRVAAAGGQGKAMEGEAQHAANLMARIEQLGRDLNVASTRHAEEKRRLASEGAKALQAQANEHRTKLLEERARFEALEDRLKELEDEAGEARQRALVIEQHERAMDNRREEAEATADQLRSELRSLQQSFQAATSLDVAQGEVVRDGESAIAALSSQSEARIRQLNNKVEFLKASLKDEQQRYSDLEEQTAGVRRRHDEVKADLRRAQQLNEDRVREATDETEQRMRLQVDEKTSEAAHLQSRVAALQAQVTDAHNDMAVAKRREDAARGEATRLSAQLSAAHTDLTKQQEYEDEMAECRRVQEEAEAKRSAAEAMLRRLDNERSYLRSQLTSEVTLKNELQATLDQATKGMGELKQQLQAEREDLVESHTAEMTQMKALEADLRNTVVQLEAALEEKGRQLANITELYTKTRDQLRLTQSEVESVRAVNKRMMEELKAAQDELEESKSAHRLAAAQAAESMGLAREAVESSAAGNAQQVKQMQKELRDAHNKVADTNRQMLEMRNEMLMHAGRSQQSVAAQRLHQGLERIWKGSLGGAFAKWKQANEAANAEALTQVQVDAAVTKAQAEAEQQHRVKSKELTAKMEQKAKDMVTSALELANKEKDDAIASTRAQAEALAQEQLKAATEAHGRRLDELTQDRSEALKRLADDHSRAMEARDRAVLEQAEAQQREVHRRVMEERQTVLLDAEERWRRVLEEREDSMRRAHTDALDAQAAHNDSLLHEHTEALRLRREEMEQEAEERVLAHMSEAENARTEAEALRSALEKAESEASSRGLQAESWETKAQEALASLEAKQLEFDEAKQAWAEEGDAAKKLLEAQKDLERKQHMDALRDEHDVGKAKAVELETNKWQKALRDAEVKLDAEKQAAWRRGMEEREKLALQESKQLKQAAAKALEEVKASAKASLEAVHKDAKEAARMAHQKGQEDARKDAEAAAASKELEHKHALELALAEAATAHASDKAKALDTLRDREADRAEKQRVGMENQRTEWVKEREKLEAAVRQLTLTEELSKSEKQNLLEKHRDNISTTLAEGEDKLTRALENQKRSLMQSHEEAKNDLTHTLREEAKAQMAAAEEKVAKQMGEAMEQVQEESDRLISELEDRLTHMRQEKQDTLEQLQATKNLVEDHDDTIYDLNNALRAAKDETEAARTKAKEDIEKAESIWQAKVSEERKNGELELEYRNREAKAEKDAMSEQLATATDLITESNERRQQMRETLVNHKREALIQVLCTHTLPCINACRSPPPFFPSPSSDLIPFPEPGHKSVV